jgi:hypothetical protein
MLHIWYCGIWAIDHQDVPAQCTTFPGARASLILIRFINFRIILSGSASF